MCLALLLNYLCGSRQAGSIKEKITIVQGRGESAPQVGRAPWLCACASPGRVPSLHSE